MNLFVIGNGFDKMHKLPTGYTDFLDFVNLINSSITFTSDTFMPQIQIGVKRNETMAAIEATKNGMVMYVSITR